MPGVLGCSPVHGGVRPFDLRRRRSGEAHRGLVQGLSGYGLDQSAQLEELLAGGAVTDPSAPVGAL